MCVAVLDNKIWTPFFPPNCHSGFQIYCPLVHLCCIDKDKRHINVKAKLCFTATKTLFLHQAQAHNWNENVSNESLCNHNSQGRRKKNVWQSRGVEFTHLWVEVLQTVGSALLCCKWLMCQLHRHLAARRWGTQVIGKLHSEYIFCGFISTPQKCCSRQPGAYLLASLTWAHCFPFQPQ